MFRMLYVFSGVVLPESPFDAWSKGLKVDIPLMIGELHTYESIPDLSISLQ